MGCLRRRKPKRINKMEVMYVSKGVVKMDGRIGWLIGAIICFITGGYLIFTSL